MLFPFVTVKGVKMLKTDSFNQRMVGIAPICWLKYTIYQSSLVTLKEKQTEKERERERERNQRGREREKKQRERETLTPFVY